MIKTVIAVHLLLGTSESCRGFVQMTHRVEHGKKRFSWQENGLLGPCAVCVMSAWVELNWCVYGLQKPTDHVMVSLMGESESEQQRNELKSNDIKWLSVEMGDK